LLKLSHPFTREAQLLSQFLQQARGILPQSISSEDHPAQALGELVDQVEQNASDEFPL
jgi:hypothetical protein